MSLKCDFRKAERIVSKLDPDDLVRLKQICAEIRDAEVRLQEKSRKLMTRCIQRCGGICCRNLQIDLVIGHWDFVFILASNPALKEKIEECLEKEEPFFTADCIFLENGVGPCVFPSDARPEVCLVTFCDDISPIRREISDVKRKFFKLTWFFVLRKPRMFKNWIAKLF